VVLAVGAIAAAVFTYQYVQTTKKLLAQAQVDSKMEYRPYVIQSEFNLEKTNGAITEGDSLVFPFKVSYRFMNRGKTPAIDFKRSIRFTSYKDTTISSINSLVLNSKESNTTATLLGNSGQGADKSFSFIFKLDKDVIVEKWVQTEKGLIKIDSRDNRYAYFYFNTAFVYTDMEKTKYYEGYYSNSILFYFTGSKLEAFSDFSYIN